MNLSPSKHIATSRIKLYDTHFLIRNTIFDPQNEMFEKTSINEIWFTQKVVYQKYIQKIKNKLGGGGSYRKPKKEEKNRL